MAKLTLKNPGSQFRSIAQIESNNDLIEAAIENTLSRDGTGPNQMEANLDMNSYRILNLPAPLSSAEAARKADVDALLVMIQALQSDSGSDNNGGDSVTGIIADNITDLINTNTGTLTDGDIISCRGRTASGDSGGGFFVYDAGSTAAADGDVIVAPASNEGRFIRKEYLDRGDLYAAWFGFKRASANGDQIQAAANGQALQDMFDFRESTNTGGWHILPQGYYEIAVDTPITVTKQDGIYIRGSGAALTAESIGTALNFIGGTATTMFDFVTTIDLRIEGILFQSGKTGVETLVAIHGGNYYDTDGVTVIDSRMISSYQINIRNCMFSGGDVSQNHDPSVAGLHLYSCLLFHVDTVITTRMDTGILLGAKGALAGDKAGRTIAKGTAGQGVVTSLYTDADIGYLKVDTVTFNSGQMSRPEGSVAAGEANGRRAAQFRELPNAELCINVMFNTFGIGNFKSVINWYQPWMSTSIAKNITVRNCNLGAYNNFIEASGDASNIIVENCWVSLADSGTTNGIVIADTCANDAVFTFRNNDRIVLDAEIVDNRTGDAIFPVVGYKSLAADYTFQVDQAVEVIMNETGVNVTGGWYVLEYSAAVRHGSGPPDANIREVNIQVDVANSLGTVSYGGDVLNKSVTIASEIATIKGAKLLYLPADSTAQLRMFGRHFGPGTDTGNDLSKIVQHSGFQASYMKLIKVG